MSVCVCVSSYDDSWISGYSPHMMAPPMHGGRFIRRPGPPAPSRAGYRSAGLSVHCVEHNSNSSAVFGSL